MNSSWLDLKGVSCVFLQASAIFLACELDSFSVENWMRLCAPTSNLHSVWRKRSELVQSEAHRARVGWTLGPQCFCGSGPVGAVPFPIALLQITFPQPWRVIGGQSEAIYPLETNGFSAILSLTFSFSCQNACLRSVAHRKQQVHTIL